jgi:hypothetical protein
MSNYARGLACWFDVNDLWKEILKIVLEFEGRSGKAKMKAGFLSAPNDKDAPLRW